MKQYKVTINETYKKYIEANDIEEAKDIAIEEYESEGREAYLISAETDLRKVGKNEEV